MTPILAENDIESLVIALIREQLHSGGDPFIDPEANLFTSGLVDSVGAMQMIAHIEEALEIKIPPTELIPANFRTIRLMAGFLAPKTGG